MVPLSDDVHRRPQNAQGGIGPVLENIQNRSDAEKNGHMSHGASFRQGTFGGRKSLSSVKRVLRGLFCGAFLAIPQNASR